MFDPTVFDNIKVVVEGDLYDLDLDGHLQVIDRKDLIDLATMSRTFRMEVTVDQSLTAIISLQTDIKQLAIEINHLKGDKPGCYMQLTFQQALNSSIAINDWEANLRRKWGMQWRISHQVIQYVNGTEENVLKTTIHLDHLIFEETIDDVRQILLLLYETLKENS
ncbi:MULTISPECIES: hypothetical protein [Sutcliffiella]|uniref:Uncharacterized protein n=1 Tax=Sutcliffiella cohnii TaxID=33932 RepID=A0A223KQI8_9BACI|nr:MULTISPECIES: hypothetical protein [Sutcliffiella]AST91729.1 hypothetical protein BC6307_10795 [Sutcliffiella cohnii]WBL17716.1 hypothetical protein O1A01_13450 [Sutcliffiella sp. NC1]